MGSGDKTNKMKCSKYSSIHIFCCLLPKNFQENGKRTQDKYWNVRTILQFTYFTACSLKFACRWEVDTRQIKWNVRSILQFTNFTACRLKFACRWEVNTRQIKWNVRSILQFIYSAVYSLKLSGRWEADTRQIMKCSNYSSIHLFYCL